MRKLLPLLLGLLLAGTALQAQPARIRALAQQLSNGNVAERREAAFALGKASFPSSVRVLDAALAVETESSVRLAIVRALRHIVFQRFPGYSEALGALSHASDATREPDELVRQRATEALWEAAKKDLLDPVPILQRILEQDPSDALRLRALAMLRKFGSPDCVDPLGRAAMDVQQSETVRLRALEALGAVAQVDGGPVGRSVAAANRQAETALHVAPLSAPQTVARHRRQVAYLSRVALDPQSSETLVLRAVKSLGQIKDRSAVPTLYRLIEQHPSPAVRKQATTVLSHVLARQYE